MSTHELGAMIPHGGEGEWVLGKACMPNDPMSLT
jgi:hypothetical protein